uniref:Uncharacterized protein n=1 Tax=Ananas comosus var. bracteatus TaxID=296719 RepID=A0A6V7P6U4_ANACO|nr:unnamed protein product [Ananas comosus var. bracteatus]
MPHSQFGICEEKLAMMMTGPGNTDGATATTVAAIHLRIRVRSHFWSASKAELLANIKIIEDAMFPDDALKAAALQPAYRNASDHGIIGRRRIIEACTLKRSHKRAAKYGDVDLMNSLIDCVLYSNAFYERLPTFVEMYKEDLHL